MFILGALIVIGEVKWHFNLQDSDAAQSNETSVGKFLSKERIKESTLDRSSF